MKASDIKLNFGGKTVLDAKHQFEYYFSYTIGEITSQILDNGAGRQTLTLNDENRSVMFSGMGAGGAYQYKPASVPNLGVGVLLEYTPVSVYYCEQYGDDDRSESICDVSQGTMTNIGLVASYTIAKYFTPHYKRTVSNLDASQNFALLGFSAVGIVNTFGVSVNFDIFKSDNA